MNILISAYACDPYKGSEPGVGWNVAVELAKTHTVYVLTRRKNRSSIEKFLSNNQSFNATFIYHDFPNWLMWLKKLITTQIYYQFWNLSAIPKIKRLLGNTSIDIIHHITFNQYRTLSFGYFLNKPFVIGPIGGAESINKVFFCELNKQTLRKERYRNKGYDYKLFSFLTRRTQAAKAYLFSANENKNKLLPYIQSSHFITETLPAIAINPQDFNFKPKSKQSAGDIFTMIYAGRALDWKGLHLFLRSLDILKNGEYRVKLIGIRNERERGVVLKWISEYKLEAKIELINFIPRNELLKELINANLFVYPAFRDSGSMAILEACALKCPSICFNAGGQDAFPDNVLLKVNVGKTFEATLDAFREKIEWAYLNQPKLEAIGKRAYEYALCNLTWEHKVQCINQIYNRIINL